MTEVPGTGIDRIANNTALLLISRLAMIAVPPLLIIVGSLSTLYLDAKLGDLDQRIRAVQTQADTSTATIVDLKIAQALTDKTDSLTLGSQAAWQSTTNTRLDKITDALNQLNATVAGLSATVRAQQ